ncbi:MAG TPA: hypothetical protein VF176_00295 [Solirubrobacterales bacterium]
MAEVTSPPPDLADPSGRGLRDWLESPYVAVGLYAAVALGATVAAFLTLFTQFAVYDDEGTLLVTLKAFANGGTLYRDIYSPYGPFYFEVFGGLFALSGHAVTTDASRSIVMVIWVGTSLLFGLAAQRLTGMLMLGLTGMIAAFGSLYVLTSEPMHPQVLCVLLLGAFVLLAVSGPTRRVLWAGGGAGALLAALVLTKVNLGAYAIAAVALAAVIVAEPLHRRRWLRTLVIAAFIAMPVAVVGRDLSIDWVRSLGAIEVLAAVALIVAAWPLRPRAGEDHRAVVRWLLAAAIGFAAAFVAIVAAILLTGPSPADVYDGVVTQAVRVRDVLLSQFPFPAAAVDWGVAAVAAAVLTVRLRPGIGGVSVWPGLLRAVAGLTIWFAVARIVPVALNPSAGNPDVLPMLLAWVAVVPPAGVREAPYKRFLRILLPALAVAETLQVYPVAGSQMGIAALTFVPVGALCLADALTDLRAWSATRGVRGVEVFGVAVTVVTVALAGQFALDSIARPAADRAVLYRDQESLPLAGAGTLRLPAAEVDTYVGVVDLLRRYRCTTFIGYPNINSIYLWSGIDPPAPAAPGAWIKALDDEQQQRIVDELKASSRPCAIRDDGRAALWLNGSTAPNSPLVHYIFNDFKAVDQAGSFQFLLPKATDEGAR